MFRAATISEYLGWLERYTANGGRLTHAYDYTWERVGFLWVSEDFRLGGECGSRARHIIGAVGVHWVGGDLGHNSVHLHDGSFHGLSVPIYSDSEFLRIKGAVDFLDRKRAESARWRNRRQDMDSLDQDGRAKSDLSSYLGRRVT